MQKIKSILSGNLEKMIENIFFKKIAYCSCTLPFRNSITLPITSLQNMLIIFKDKNIYQVPINFK